MRCRDHVDAFRAAFEEARRARPGEIGDISCVVAGRQLTARTVGSDLEAAIRRPLLGSDGASHAGLRLDLWDAPPDISPRFLEDPDDLGEGRGENGELLAVSSDGTAVRFRARGLLLWLDRPRGRVVGRVSSVDELSPWHRYRPLQALLAYWLAGSGVRIVHASAISRGDRAVLLVGPNGVGKSTCAMAALAAGLDVLGDDVVGVEAATRVVHAIYTVIKTRTPPEVVDGSVERMELPDGRPEWVTFLNEAAPQRLRRSASIEAIVFPELAHGAESSVRAIRRTDAIKVLLLTDQMGNADTLTEAFGQWGRLADEVPCSRLEVGRDPVSLGGTLLDLTEGAAR